MCKTTKVIAYFKVPLVQITNACINITTNNMLICCRQYFVVVFKEKPFELWDLRSGAMLRQMPKNFPHITALVNDALYLIRGLCLCSSLSLLQYCWNKTKVSYYPDYRNIQYEFLMLCSSWDIDLVS